MLFRKKYYPVHVDTVRTNSNKFLNLSPIDEEKFERKDSLKIIVEIVTTEKIKTITY